MTKIANVVILKMLGSGMKNSEKQELKKKIKRLGLFLLIVFLPTCVVAVLLAWAKVDMWLNVFVLVVMLFLLFALFIWACQKLDEKKQERMSKKKDPFSDN